MEIQTTLKHLPERLKQLNISPEASVRVIIEEIEITEEKPSGEPFLPFPDDDDFWEGEDAPLETRKIPPDIFDDLIGVVDEREDGSVNHDAYLNDEHRP